MFAHYGNRCACCGESETLFLSIDHINGRSDPRQLNGRSLYAQIIQAGYPTDLRLLCMNCNWGRRATVDKRCPHEGGHMAIPAPPRQTNGEKTECPRGHPYDGTNVRRTASGGRRCRACRLDGERAWRAAQLLKPMEERRSKAPPKAECVRGHPYTEENTAWLVTGQRRCRECHADHSRRQHAKKRARQMAAAQG